MTPVVWSKQALADLDGIVTFIAADNPQAALAVLARIERTAGTLGRFQTGRPGRVSGTFEKPVVGLPYVVAYEIVRDRAARETVAILRVIHGARDWPSEGWPS